MRGRGVETRRTVALAAALLGLLAAGPAGAETLQERLDRALTIAGVSRAQTGAVALRADTGRVVYGLHRDRSLAPASNQKLAVSLGVLDRLGAGYRIQTRVLGQGSLSGTTWQGRLVLKGFGDPTLTRRDLRTLAVAVRNQGIRRVTGKIAGDESYFDRRRTARGWRPSWYKVESPPLSALVVGRARVGGRTVDDPALAAARAFRAELRDAGVSVGGKAVVAKAANSAAFLTRIRSGEIERLVLRMNKVSDNFSAEMLLKHLGARLRGAGTTRAGCAVLRGVLRRRDVPLEGVRLADGSGLSRYNRFTARSLARLLLSARQDPAVGPALVASLPIAGVDGTLADRMESGPARGRVRAKTGTTSKASALSGYVGGRYLFSVLQNGQPVNWTNARRAQDRFAQRLAGAL
ncbi:MAG TPA: D-alanyl-D-alanine carboxypeptidase/D-alanyl-D-alanine-endopeptidase [Gaiellaceae bacterium]|nr:D-alanyl-D-alanine carboxypeptidase/D-alanyl-D-alanine-endopeptidase [Gaiellaceae bacterium]